MSHLDRFARRALCLHPEGAAVPLATHRTQAPAARKRGGGPAHICPVNAMPHGRQPLPEGGEIDSLCRAAAGIIPPITPLISAHNGAHAYSTEGVRRAQKMEPRSAGNTSPAAQLVEVYMPLVVQPQLRQMASRSGLDSLDGPNCALKTELRLVNQPPTVLRLLHGFDYQLTHTNNCMPQLDPANGSFNMGDAFVADLCEKHDSIVDCVGEKPEQLFVVFLPQSGEGIYTDRSNPFRDSYNFLELLPLAVPSHLDLRSTLHSRNPYRDENGSNGANSLDKCRKLLPLPSPQIKRIRNEKRGRAANQYYPHASNRKPTLAFQKVYQAHRTSPVIFLIPNLNNWAHQLTTHKIASSPIIKDSPFILLATSRHEVRSLQAVERAE